MKGLLKEDRLLIENDKQAGEDFATVAIADKDGYNWQASGEAGMVVIKKGNESEVDIVGSGENVSKLLATALIKVREMIGRDFVDKALELYEQR
jgi:hypothetical protein